ncbi:hypothetical protein OGATHE_001809 [Ogataea polymorpha]|uniref:Uncharacterized protein n=1 Tax=Ogataea polymorpha TaxID=460523 RepID=A0A9P8PM88_9ASCO|nr:hypothetical protein OGATHE_001809 [Ogataea polymorpha]
MLTSESSVFGTSQRTFLACFTVVSEKDLFCRDFALMSSLFSFAKPLVNGEDDKRFACFTGVVASSENSGFLCFSEIVETVVVSKLT